MLVRNWGTVPSSTRAVVVLARGEVGEHVADAPARATRRLVPVGVAEPGKEAGEPFRLGGHQIVRIETGQIPVVNHCYLHGQCANRNRPVSCSAA